MTAEYINSIKDKVRVVDAMPGSGKSTAILSYISKEKDKRFIWITPVLSESESRVQEFVPDFIAPQAHGSKTKDFLRLAAQGKNISITHSLFMILPPEAIDLLADYHIIIDETVEVVKKYEDCNKDDIWLLQSSGLCSVNDNKMLIWQGDKYPSQYADFKQCVENETLYQYNDNLLMWLLSKKFVDASASVTVLTHRFEHSLMKAWMSISDIPYITLNNTLLGLQDDTTLLARLRDNLNIITPSGYWKLSDTSRTSFSMTWYNTRTPHELEKLRKSLEKISKDMGVRSGNVFWTCFKDHKYILSGARYTRPSDGRKPWVPKNARGLNEYRDCTHCLYLVNVFMNVDLKQFLHKQNILIDEDQYALSEMLQFIYRGAIRDNSPMSLFIPSSRMSSLLLSYINGSE